MRCRKKLLSLILSRLCSRSTFFSSVQFSSFFVLGGGCFVLFSSLFVSGGGWVVCFAANGSHTYACIHTNEKRGSLLGRACYIGNDMLARRTHLISRKFS